MDSIILINYLNEIIVFRPAAETIFGYSKDEVPGQLITLLMREEFRYLQINILESYLKTERSKIIDKQIEINGLRKMVLAFRWI
ncbi:MAG: PAS domain S-box-containing protein [Gammaproteobacteria bacterium]